MGIALVVLASLLVCACGCLCRACLGTSGRGGGHAVHPAQGNAPDVPPPQIVNTSERVSPVASVDDGPDAVRPPMAVELPRARDSAMYAPAGTIHVISSEAAETQKGERPKGWGYS